MSLRPRKVKTNGAPPFFHYGRRTQKEKNAAAKLKMPIALNGYQLIELLGEGSSGSVFKARQKSTAQIVAVKLLRQDNQLDDARRKRLIERFDREAQLCGQLHHPNIVGLLDKGKTNDDRFFVVFEYVPGETLRDLLLRKGALSAVATGELMGQVLDALACAHAQGIAHRDLKPHNIMVTATGTRAHIKVLDFGIAALAPELQKGAYRNLTITQEAFGTPSYSAPEQLRGEPPTTKTDLYAWGLLVIECLTGKPAVQGSTLAEIIYKQLSPLEVPLPPALAGHPLADLLRRALKKNPRDRAAHAAGLYTDFRKLDFGNILGNPNQSGQQVYSQEQLAANGLTQESSLGWLDRQYERRQMTALCCSLFLASTTDTEPELEALEALQRDQLNLCSDTASRYGGHLAGSLGDSLMFYYGYPYVTDNDARRAAHMALDLVGQVRRRSRLLEIQQGIKLDIRVGVHTGIVLTQPGHPPTGLTPNIALRLNQLAPPGAILVSGTARQILQQYVEFEESGANPIGASSRALPAYLMRAERGSGAPSSLRAGRHNRPLIGRTTELALLIERWNATKARRSHTTLLIGEAGIGKSRLAYEVCRAIREDGLLIRECRCLPEHQNIALHPILQLIKTHLRLPETGSHALAVARLESGLKGCTGNIERTLPILCSWLSLPLPDNFTQMPHSADRQRKILLDILQQLLTRMGNGNPFLLLVEDIHWADQTSLELIERLAKSTSRAVSKSPFLLILTARPEFSTCGNACPLETINLQRLSDNDSKKMICKIIGGTPINEKSLSTLAERVDGIPLFVEELTRMLLENETLTERNGIYRLDRKLNTGAIPITLRDSLTERLGRMGAAKETAQLAATIGREFSHTLLVDASLRDEATVQTDLDRLIAADFVYRQRGVQGDGYIFRHALIRDAAYDAMPRRIREQTHARIARALENQPAVEIERNLAQLARHFANAAEFANAVKYGAKAAQASLERALHDDAINHANDVLHWIEKLEPNQRAEAASIINAILTNALMSKYG
jgi:TOMM system kinase/cyclase fusion protein